MRNTLILRTILSLAIFLEYASLDPADALLNKVGSEYLLTQDPGPPGSNLKEKHKFYCVANKEEHDMYENHPTYRANANVEGCNSLHKNPK